MKTPMRTVAAALALALSLAGAATAQESKVVLKEGPGKDKAMQCIACHSLDYIQMNSAFLDREGWLKSVDKMIKVMGAPIRPDDVAPIVDYLTAAYGK